MSSSVTDDFRLYWALMAKWQVTIIERAYGDTFDASRLNNLTLGLDRYARRNMHRLPLAIMRLRATRRRTAQFFGTYDAVLTPTVADETPRLGYFDRTADSQQIMDRGVNWNAFAWLQNITGEPAISLPLAESASGMPVGMMLSCRRRTRSAAAGIGLRTRRGPALDPHPVSRSGLMRAVCALLVELPGIEPASATLHCCLGGC